MALVLFSFPILQPYQRFVKPYQHIENGFIATYSAVPFRLCDVADIDKYHFSASFSTSSIISLSNVRNGFFFASAILRATASISSFTRITTTVPTLRITVLCQKAFKQGAG